MPPTVIAPGTSRLRSRLGWQIPLLGMPVLLVLSLVLAVTRAIPPGIGVIAFFWLLYQFCWVGGPTITSRAQLPRWTGSGC